MFRADHSDASYGSASVLSRSPRYSDMERHNKHPKGGSHLSDVIVTGWERSRGVLGYGYGWHSRRLVDLCGYLYF
ncbi:hypothetical protein HanRHA438_Chr11g0492651 [Helianthus annuus]|uniref:Uncharacterized protein n=1 Tax=Helianthus annuus TaxID=4232 RepID=A0A251T923_HELAN|nr:hypothetical protein HanXRQr2_Chr11g0479351 [Helianthus annuus]KAJ0500767.1 hypothetical protein HanHA300_Chr11g0393061 [Helianthus annuus]KAJ0516636.1 hypothetical protein HanHA89_Chr11g0416011 [Helianthus annuus]KAJ0684641.1 hypothetical protein HanLR1_Chr11g0393421 [Helianthus annuus]KAJ0688585.1 hypothetical protein HanOQP8_Chr11g0395901 [Helianthus annuus]